VRLVDENGDHDHQSQRERWSEPMASIVDVASWSAVPIDKLVGMEARKSERQLVQKPVAPESSQHSMPPDMTRGRRDGGSTPMEAGIGGMGSGSSS
jgi:hypothetical protein